MSEERRCLYCNNILTKNKKQKYCNEKCFYDWNYTNNKEYKERFKLRSKNYYNTHKDHCNKRSIEYLKNWLKDPEHKKNYNTRMRIVMNSRSKRLRKEWAEKNLCLRCGRERDDIYKSCRMCLDKRKKYGKKTETTM
jgi:hypothetical protein